MPSLITKCHSYTHSPHQTEMSSRKDPKAQNLIVVFPELVPLCGVGIAEVQLIWNLATDENTQVGCD